MFTHSVY